MIMSQTEAVDSESQKPARRRRTTQERIGAVQRLAERLVGKTAKSLLSTTPEWRAAVEIERELRGRLHRCRVKIAKQHQLFGRLRDELTEAAQTLEQKHSEEREDLMKMIQVAEQKAAIAERAVLKAREAVAVTGVIE